MKKLLALLSAVLLVATFAWAQPFGGEFDTDPTDGRHDSTDTPFDGGTAPGGGGSPPGGGSDTYLLETGGTDCYLLESGGTDCYLLE